MKKLWGLWFILALLSMGSLGWLFFTGKVMTGQGMTKEAKPGNTVR